MNRLLLYQILFTVYHFFIATSFHGIYVIIGTTFLSISLYRLINLYFSNLHHFGFEAAA